MAVQQQRIVWDNELEMTFLEHYRSEYILWDSTHIYHKSKNITNDAWKRISTEMNIPIEELKRKKDSLLSSFRFYKKKIRSTMRTGARPEEIYKPIWFAYAYIDSFLGKGSTVKRTTDTLNEDQNVEDPLSQENDNNNDNILPPNNENHIATQTKKRRRKNPPELKEAESFVKESLANLNQAFSSWNNYQENEDDCDRYGKILANKLRTLPEDDRLIFMHQIDGMFIQKRSLVQDRLSRNIPGSSLASYSETITLQTTHDENHDSRLAESEPIQSKNP